LRGALISRGFRSSGVVVSVLDVVARREWRE
jgi:hypothetical protein